MLTGSHLASSQSTLPDTPSRPQTFAKWRRVLVKEVKHHGRTHASRRRTSNSCHSPCHSRRRRGVRKNLLRRFHNPREQAQIPARFPSSGDSCTRALDNVFAPVVLLRGG